MRRSGAGPSPAGRRGKEGRLARCGGRSQGRRRLRRWLPAVVALGCWAPRAMFSVLSYGRLVARAVLGGLSQTDSRDYSLVTASCGFGKDFRKGILKKGMCYGDDACFVARHRSADVLGEYPGGGGHTGPGLVAVAQPGRGQRDAARPRLPSLCFVTLTLYEPGLFCLDQVLWCLQGSCQKGDPKWLLSAEFSNVGKREASGHAPCFPSSLSHTI